MFLLRNKIFGFLLRLCVSLACLCIFSDLKTSESSYLPVTGSNIGIGTATPVGALTVMSGNVGIGTWSPTAQLQVIGNVSVTDEAYGGGWDGSANVPTKNAVYDQVQSLIVGGAGGWTDGGTNVYTSTTTDNVGIGTTTPSSTVEIVKTSAGTAPLMVSTTATSDGDLLVITSSGNIGVGTIDPVGALTVMNGNVGIGTWSPNGALVIMNGNVGIGTSMPNDGYLTLRKMDSGIERNFIQGYSDNGLVSFSIASDLNRFSKAIFYDNSEREAVKLQTYWASHFLPSAYMTYGGLVVGSNVTASLNPAVGLYVAKPANLGAASFYGNVGLGTTYPKSLLTIAGSSGVSIGIGTSAVSSFVQSAAPSGGLLVENNVGIGTTTPVGGLTVMNGNVGIGTWSPTQRLQVVGTVDATYFVGDGSGLTNVTGANSGWTDGGTNVYTSTTTDNVGIGTTTPTAALLVENAGTQASFRINDAVLDSSPFIVMSDGNVGIGTTSPVGALTVMSGNVGIGTSVPRTQLEVRGTEGNIPPFWSVAQGIPAQTAAGRSP